MTSPYRKTRSFAKREASVVLYEEDTCVVSVTHQPFELNVHAGTTFDMLRLEIRRHVGSAIDSTVHLFSDSRVWSDGDSIEPRSDGIPSPLKNNRINRNGSRIIPMSETNPIRKFRVPRTGWFTPRRIHDICVWDSRKWNTKMYFTVELSVNEFHRNLWTMVAKSDGDIRSVLLFFILTKGRESDSFEDWINDAGYKENAAKKHREICGPMREP
jgi:hypothetical protein